MTMNRGPLEDLLSSTWRICLRGMAFAAIVSCFINALQLLMPIYTLQVYDRVLNSRSFETLAMLTVLTLVGFGVMAALDYVRARVMMVLGAATSQRLNGVLLKAAVEESLRSRHGAAAQAVRDLNDLRGFLAGSAVLVPLDMAWTPIFLLVMFMMHPIYGFVAMGAAALLTIMAIAVEFFTRRPLAAANDALNTSFTHVGAAVRNAEVIEAMGMLRSVLGSWQNAQGRALASLDVATARSRAFTAATRSVRMALQVGMIATGVMLVLSGEASPGSMIAASILMGRALQPFEQLIDGWRQWAVAIHAFRRVRKLLLETEPLRQDMVLPAPKGLLVAEKVAFLPPGSDRPILRNVGFTVEPGEVLGIIGPSASGKSTLARLIMGVWDCTAGGIYLDGNSVFLWERDGFGRHVGYLPQNVALLDGTIRDNIARMGDGDPAAVVAAARMAGIHDMIGRLPRGYETVVGEGGYALSGGQRQRIGLARALYGNPRLVVLDEPNANLDGEGEAALVEAIAAAKEQGSTVVLIAHRPAVMSVVDKVLVLKEGVVERFGSAAEVLKAYTPVAVVGERRRLGGNPGGRPA